MSTVSIYYGSQITTTYLAEGIIYDQVGHPLLNCSTQLYINSTGKPLTSIFNLPDASYSAWTDDNPYAYDVVFRCRGYKDQKIRLSTLIDHPNVTMEKDTNSIEPWMIIAVLGAAYFLIKKKKKKGELGKIGSADTITIFMLVGGVIAFAIVYKILVKFGLLPNSTVDNETTNPASAFRPDYWKQFTSFSYAITEQQAADYSMTIWNALTIWRDDYNAIMGVFSQMRTKANVSFLADVFQRGLKMDLLTFLNNGSGLLPWDGLSAEHINTIINLVKKLPSN